MKKVLFGLVLTVFAGTLWASSGEKLRSLYDVVAPVLSGNPAAADRQVGQIYYDNASGGFKGINKNGGIDTLTNATGGSLSSLAKAHVESANALVFDQIDGFAAVVFSQESYDANNLHNPATGAFTATTAGVYTLSATLQVARLFNVNDAISIAILKNGVEFLDIQSESFYIQRFGMVYSLNNDYLLAAGDTLQIVVQLAPTGGTISAGSFANFKQVP